MRLGRYPTPVDRYADALGPGRPLWVKRDDRTSPLYGGNKVRKLERVLADARAAGARRIVTVGAAGSHHVLATALFGRDLGIAVDAVLVPQPRTSHVAENLRVTASLATVFPATSYAHAAALVVDRIACGARYVPPGGSTRSATRAYAAAARELVGQVARGELPMPHVVVVTLGSGGTAAGLAAGFARLGVPVRVVAVVVSQPAAWVGWHARALARRCASEGRRGVPTGTLRLSIDTSQLGPGYGYPTDEARRAVDDAARLGLALDTTYTGKTFAALRRLAPSSAPVVYWHTLSSAPMAPLLGDARREEDLPAGVRQLLLPEIR